MEKKKIVKNAIQCNICGEILESTHVYDFKMCSCGSCGVDGGTFYLRRLYKEEGCYTELSIEEETSEDVR